MNSNRKRQREEELCDLPLSKKINKLKSMHLNNIASGNFSQEPVQATDRKPTYDPGLDSSQSSYYYNNKLLFELHLERLERTGQPYPG